LKTLSFQDFVPYRNAMFRVEEAAGYELELSDLTDHSNAQLDQFSLIFTSLILPWLPQGTYTLVHADQTEIILFIVPIGPIGNTMRYECVFSRFVK
jgi:hypothetical protein